MIDEMKTLTFSEALMLLKEGLKVRAADWPPESFIVLMPRIDLPPFNSTEVPRVNDRTAKHIGKDVPLRSLPYFAHFDGFFWNPGWIPSQWDLVREDWQPENPAEVWGESQGLEEFRVLMSFKACGGDLDAFEYLKAIRRVYLSPPSEVQKEEAEKALASYVRSSSELAVVNDRGLPYDGPSKSSDPSDLPVRLWTEEEKKDKILSELFERFRDHSSVLSPAMIEEARAVMKVGYGISSEEFDRVRRASANPMATCWAEYRIKTESQRPIVENPSFEAPQGNDRARPWSAPEDRQEAVGPECFGGSDF